MFGGRPDLVEQTQLSRDDTCVYLCSLLWVTSFSKRRTTLQVAAATAAVLLLHVTQTFSCVFASHPAQSRSLPAALSLRRTPPTWQRNHKKIKGGAFFAMKAAFCKAGCRPGSLAWYNYMLALLKCGPNSTRPKGWGGLGGRGWRARAGSGWQWWCFVLLWWVSVSLCCFWMNASWEQRLWFAAHI